MMKICLVTNLYEPYRIGGAEIYVSRIARRLSQDHQVSVITACPFAGRRSLVPACRVEGRIKIWRFFPLNFYHIYEAKKKPGWIKPFWHALDIWNPHSFSMLSRILQEEKPDIVHTHNLNGISLSAFDSVKRFQVPLIHTCHDFSLLCPFATLFCAALRGQACRKAPAACAVYRWLKKRAASAKPDLVIYPSEATRRIFTQYDFWGSGASTVLPYCVAEPGHVSEAVQAKQTFDILYVGQLVEHKGVQRLIDAFKRLDAKHLRLHIVGDGAYARRLKEFAASDSRIVFYGKVAPEETQRFYRMADITVVPSLWQEVLGIVILESFSAATPVLASSRGGMVEFVREGYNGFLFDPDQPGELEALLSRVIGDPVLAAQLSRNARESAGAFGIESHVEFLLKLYGQAEILSQKAGVCVSH